MHDVFGCADCFVDPHNRHVSYCPLSMYNPFHPSHICLGGVPCSCDMYCQGHSSLDTPSELNPPQRIPSPLFVALLVPQAEG